MKKIGLVTVLYKSGDVLEDFFRSISRLGNIYRLYIVDNNETETDVEPLRAAAAKYSVEYAYVSFGVNRGVALGNNLGARMALADGCDWLGIINNDIVFDNPEIFEEMTAECDGKKVDVAVPFLTYFGTQIPWFNGGRFTKIKATSPHDGYLINDGGTLYTDYAPTCFMLIRATEFKRIGEFDEKYFVYYDDADWVYRYRRAGGKILYCKNQLVEHKVSISTGGKESNFSVFYSTRNRIYFANKNYSNLAWSAFLVYFFIFRAPFRLFQLSTPLRKSYFRGIGDGIRMLRTGMHP